MTSAAERGRLREILEPVVSAAGCDLEDVRVTPAGRRSVLQVVVDRDGGVGLDDVAEVSRAVSEVLDAADPLGPQPYVLEVTSPGVDRPLTAPRHWRRALGRSVATSVAGRTVTGRVLEVDEDGVVLEVDGVGERFRHEELGQGRVQLDFGAGRERA